MHSGRYHYMNILYFLGARRLVQRRFLPLQKIVSDEIEDDRDLNVFAFLEATFRRGSLPNVLESGKNELLEIASTICSPYSKKKRKEKKKKKTNAKMIYFSIFLT